MTDVLADPRRIDPSTSVPTMHDTAEDAEAHAGATGTEKRTAAGRMLSLLGAFGRGGGALTLSELSRYADLSLTTTHRLAKEFLAWGGVVMDSEGRYRLSNKILELASSSAPAFELRERALPFLMDLHRRTGLSVQLAAREDDHVMYLEALRMLPNFSGENRIGGRLPLHATATGLVLLAYSDDGFVDRFLSRPLHAYTPHTLTDPAELRPALTQVRHRRYAVAPRSISLETGSVAAPVIGPDLEVIAAVNAIYFVDRHDVQNLVHEVLATANQISRVLAETRPAPDPRTIDFNRRQAGLIPTTPAPR